jgi:hypothetical protein
MKTLRLALLLPVLALLVAVPAAADTRAVPTSDATVPASTIEGTITHLSIPFAGGGPIVTLLDGLVHFDATGASVKFADGTAGTTASLAAGQRIVAFVDATASPLRATSIVVLLQRNDVALTGKVDTVDTAARTLTVLGFTARVTEKTVFGGPMDGAGQTGLADLKVGDLVLVAATADSGTLVANRVMKLAPSVETSVRLHGTVDSIGTESWTIVTKDGAKTTVKVSSETKVVGEPKVGDEVDVLARRQSDGTLLALLIAKFVAPPTVPTERYQGVVKSISAASWTVGPKVGDGPDKLFAVNAQTKISGDPKVGDEVGVLAQRQPDGTLLALSIVKVTVAPPIGAVSFDGVVKSITPAPSAGPAGSTVVGTWVVDATKVLVSRVTVVKGDPKVGDKVHVDGVKNPDGTVLAALVAKLP